MIYLIYHIIAMTEMKINNITDTKKAGDVGFDMLSHMIVEIIIFGSSPNVLPIRYSLKLAFTAPKYILTDSNGRNKGV